MARAWPAVIFPQTEAAEPLQEDREVEVHWRQSNDLWKLLVPLPPESSSVAPSTDGIRTPLLSGSNQSAGYFQLTQAQGLGRHQPLLHEREPS